MLRPAEPRAASDLATAQARLTTRFGQARGSARPRTSAPPGLARLRAHAQR